METNFYDRISDYIDGLLEPAEKELFEQALLKDADLKKELGLQQFLHRTLFKEEVTKEQVNNFKKSLPSLTQTYFSAAADVQKPAKIVRFKKWLAPLAVAASIVFAIIVLFPKSGIDDYTMPDSSTTVRGNGNTDKAAALYAAKKYEEALPLYKQQLDHDSTEAGNRFFYALCLLKTKQYTIALPFMEQLSTGSSAYKDEATFFTALCAYKLGDKEKAKLYAEQVSEKNKNYKQAQKIKNS